MGSCTSQLLSSGEEADPARHDSRVAPVSGAAVAYNSASSTSHSKVVYRVAHIAPHTDDPAPPPPCSPCDCQHGQGWPSHLQQQQGDAEERTAATAAAVGSAASSPTLPPEGSDASGLSFAPTDASDAEPRLSASDPGGSRLSLHSSSPLPSVRFSASLLASPLSTNVHLSIPVTPEPPPRSIQSFIIAPYTGTDSPPPPPNTAPASPPGIPCTYSSHVRHQSLSILQVLRETNHSRSTSVAGVDSCGLGGSVLGMLQGGVAGGDEVVGEVEGERGSRVWNRKGSLNAGPPADVRESEEEEAAA